MYLGNFFVIGDPKIGAMDGKGNISTILSIVNGMIDGVGVFNFANTDFAWRWRRRRRRVGNDGGGDAAEETAKKW